MQTILSPIKSIREHCLWCCFDSKTEVRLCPAKECAAHPYRFGRSPTEEEKKLYKKPVPEVLKSIRNRCIDCAGYHPEEVEKCEHTDCQFWHYRFSTNPNRKGLKGEKEVCQNEKI